MENVKISSICGLCAGCKNAINLATNATIQSPKVTLFKEIVHNENVNKNLKKLGINTKNLLSEFEPDELAIIRAHGEPPETYNFFETHNIKYIDCTCGNVQQIHKKVEEFSLNGYTNIIIGKYGKDNKPPHPEILGTKGWSKTEPILIEDEEDLQKLENVKNQKFYLTCQTTFNEKKADFLIEKISKLLQKNNNFLEINKSICYAQKAINKASLELAETCDLMIVVGSKKSSNTIELFNNISKVCKTIFLENIDNLKDILEAQGIQLTKDTKVGITAGASTHPDELKNLKLKIEGEICQTI